MPTDAEIAWAAGLFEGEGTFTYSPRHVRAQLNMTDFEPVRRFAEIVGVGVLSHKPAQKAHHADQLAWRATSTAGVEHVFAMLRPWLGARRIAQAESALSQMAQGVAETQARRDAACKNGHPRTSENTYVYWHRQKQATARACRVCRSEQGRKQRAGRAS